MLIKTKVYDRIEDLHLIIYVKSIECINSMCVSKALKY